MPTLWSSKAREEYKFRQIGLAVSIASIGLLMLTLYLKLRQNGERKSNDVMRIGRQTAENGFFPSGAIFFFVLLLAFLRALWLVIYWLMIARS